MASDILAIFPSLRVDEKFEITSQPTVDYNCIAWAAGDDSRWWWPDSLGVSYWPTDERTETVDAFVAAFSTLGYAICDDWSYSTRYEKVAIYASKGVPTHASRQTALDTWTSKCGNSFDISHSLNSLDGKIYGSAVCVMVRTRSDDESE